MNTQKWRSRLQVEQCPQSVRKRQKLLAPLSSSGRGLSWCPKEAGGREKRKCVVDDGKVKDGNRRSRLHCALTIFRLLHIFILPSGSLCGGENKTPFSLEIDSWANYFASRSAVQCLNNLSPQKSSYDLQQCKEFNTLNDCHSPLSSMMLKNLTSECQTSVSPSAGFIRILR